MTRVLFAPHIVLARHLCEDRVGRQFPIEVILDVFPSGWLF